MRSAIALALTFSCAGLLVAIAPACSSSSSPTITPDSGPGKDSSTADSKVPVKDGSTNPDTAPPTDTGPPTCTKMGDAGAYLHGGDSACAICLSSMCSGGVNLIEQCSCEPDCIVALQYLDSCVADGGSTTACAIGGLDLVADAAPATMTGGAILTCVGTSSSSPCFTACNPAPADGGDGG